MSISPIATSKALEAYRSAQQQQTNARTELTEKNKAYLQTGFEKQKPKSMSETVTDSLKTVNSMNGEKNKMIESFAAGESSNVHELMITMQKASVAVKMTSAVRSKVMQAYQEVMKMPF